MYKNKNDDYIFSQFRYIDDLKQYCNVIFNENFKSYKDIKKFTETIDLDRTWLSTNKAELEKIIWNREISKGRNHAIQMIYRLREL